MKHKAIEQKKISHLVMCEIDPDKSCTQEIIFHSDIICHHLEHIKPAVFELLDSEFSEIDNLNLNMIKVRSIDSMGIDFIVTLIKRLKRTRCSISILTDQPALLKLFKFTGIENLVTLINFSE